MLMFTDELLEVLLTRFKNDQSLSNWTALYSLLTWRKVGWALGSNTGKFHETSITQDLVYSFYELGNGTKLPVELYEAKDEKANGNDLELFIENADGYLSFPIQAKIINRKFRYPKFHYKNSSGKQLQLLVDYARKRGAIPLYLFYNCVGNYEWHQRGCDRNPLLKTVELYGCSIASAFYLQDNFAGKTPGFYDIHPQHGLDLQTFLDKARLVIDIDSVPFAKLSTDAGVMLRYYAREEVVDEKNWLNRTPLPSIGRIDPRIKKQKKSVAKTLTAGKQFNPKFRIVIPLQKQFATLVHMS